MRYVNNYMRIYNIFARRWRYRVAVALILTSVVIYNIYLLLGRICLGVYGLTMSSALRSMFILYILFSLSTAIQVIGCWKFFSLWYGILLCVCGIFCFAWYTLIGNLWWFLLPGWSSHPEIETAYDRVQIGDIRVHNTLIYAHNMTYCCRRWKYCAGI